MTYRSWLDYFLDHQQHLDHIGWTNFEPLTPFEFKAISASLQQFQKGENSEGKNLIRFARESNLPDYLDTIILFIREEQRHAAILGQFMKFNGIDRIREHWVDTVFRKLRTLAGLENSILVLLTAEIIAAVYYRALMQATGSTTLKQICEQILLDEELHINFQSFTLHHFYKIRTRAGQLVIRMFHRVLMAGTIGLVWMMHRRVLRLGGYDIISFYGAVMDEFERSDNMITGKEEIRLTHAAKSPLAWTSQ